MRVIEVGACLSNEANGVSYTVSRLSEAVRRQGADVHLHVLAPEPAPLGEYRIHSHSHSKWGVLSKLGVSPEMKRALHETACQADILHSHGLWTMPSIYPASAVRGKACRLVNSPHGSLSGWALQWRAGRKRVFWFLAQSRALRASHCLHAHAEAEYQDIRRAGFRGPVAIIPTGIEVSPEVVRSESGPRRLLFLSRIHPKKGIDVLLRAWGQLERQFPEWELRICGSNAEGFQPQMQELASTLGLQRVSFGGYVNGEAGKREEFGKAHLFVLPTHSENFGVAVAEALANGVPAIVTKGAPWSGLETRNCGWWIEHGVDPLVECLRTALALSPDKLHGMGRLGRQWMEREFSWELVGQRMLETYRWLVGGGTPPGWVQIK